MLKPLIWGSQGPNWEEEEDQKSPWREQTPSISQSQNSNTTATTAAGGLGFKRELPLEEDRRNENLSSTSAPTPRPRGIYDPNRGSALLGPLSVNDPQLQPPDKISGGSGDRFILSESFFNIASPFGPFGAGNDWRVLPRDAPEHVHRLLRALVAAQDYAGAARALATLHRLHSAFDPDVYRYTVALLRLAGDHQKTSMYFRKVLGKKTRSISNASTLQARAIAHDFLSYLADAQKFDEAIHVSQNVLQSGSLSNHGAFKLDPSLKAHGAVLQLFAALLEHQACDCDAPSPKASSATTPPATAGAHGADGAGERWQRQQFSAAPPRVPRLQDPLSLIGQLRVCWAECSGATAVAVAAAAAAVADSPRGRAREHLKHAKRLLEQAAAGAPGDASIAGYRAAVTAAESGTVVALQQLAGFVERNPGSVKGRGLHARLLEMSFREAQRRAGAEKIGRKQQQQQQQGERETGNGGGAAEAEEEEEAGQGEGGGSGDKAAEGKEEEPDDDDDDINGSLLVGVARARALRGWLETDPLEPRAALGLAALHSTASGAVVGVADRAFVVDGLVGQLETSCRGSPRSCPSTAVRGVLHTTRAAMALWAALADLLGPLRVRDEPVPVRRRGRGGGGDSGDSGGGNGMRRRRPIATMPMLMPMRPPRPGTLWDHLYGSNPPWAPTDFGDRQGRGGGFGPGGGGCCGYDGTGGVFDGGAREAEKEAGGCPGFGSSPHPLLRGVDRELWEETVLDPGGEALLLVGTRGGGRARATVGEDSKTWCSDDEDCVSDDESELLQECARLASRRTGGCLYYSPPGGEEGFRARTGGEEGRGRGGGGGGGGGKSRVARQEALPFFETNVSAIVLEGMVGVPGDGGACDATGRKKEEEERVRKGATDKRGRDGIAGCPGGRDQRKGTVSRGVEVEEESSEAEGDGRARKRRRKREEAEKGGTPDGGAGGSSSSSSNDRRSTGRQDGDEAEVFGAAGEARTVKLEPHGNDEDEDEDVEDDGDVATALREPKALLSRPMGTDAAATRLSETFLVQLPEAAAVWLLAHKCCVAAHMFGPQHRYCLKAIGRLCREDVRETARSARAALRSRGFRLQLSLTRLAADNARTKAAGEGGRPSVAWGLPDPPPSAANALPPDCYVPEPVPPSGGRCR